ncbi:MAG TPA: hypothetical protein VF062_22395 [Candidatus Limnocylindrales bacterium]
MRFMNDWDIARAYERYTDHPVLGPATRTLANLRDWTDANSDGWAYWPKPIRAAAKLQALITGDGTYAALHDLSRATPAAYRQALTPIKAFRTRQGADFEIVEV